MKTQPPAKPLAFAISQAIAAAAAVTFTPAVFAQEQEEEVTRLEEITVTARKVQEDLQKTPISITAITGAALEDRQIFRTDVLDQVVPNLQFANNAPLAGNNSSSQVFIRGIGQTDPTSTVDPGVGLYIDDVYIGNAVGASMALRDVANVQVLRGPQGTLFGRNTIGGAVLLTTKDPGEEVGGEFRAEIGDNSLMDGMVALDMPFAPSFRTRLALGMRKQDGYVTRSDGTDLGDTDTFFGQWKAVWTPSDRLRATFIADMTSSNENGSPLVFAAINEAATFPRVASLNAGCPGLTDGAVPPPGLPDQPRVPMINDARCANDFQNAGPYANNGTLPLFSTLDNLGLSANFAYDLTDNITLKSITAYRESEWTGARDADNTPLPILHTIYDVEGDQLSEELQFLYETEQLVGVFGLYYFEQTSEDIATVSLNPPPPGVQQDSDNNDVDNSSWAAFTQWTYKFADKFAITLGGRYTEDEKGSYPDQFDYSTPNNKQVPVQWYRQTFTSFTPSASFSVEWSDNAMTYLSYSEGFKGGGWNSHFNDPPLTAAEQAALQQFDPEEAQTIELGVKLELADSTLRINAAVFTSDYTDMQMTYRGPFRAPPAASGVAPFITNAGETSIDGAEAEFTWAPTDNLLIDASVGYLQATIDSLDNIPLAVLPPGLVEGNFLPYAPEWQTHLGVAYLGHIGKLGFKPRVDASFQPTTFFDATNTPEIAQLDDVLTVNASVVVNGGDDSAWSVTVGVNNLTDEEYPIAGNSSLTTGSGYAEIAYARPMEWFASLKFEF
ncbi:MAG TPA: TonB-dependent receptor [Steroidobacteraceae bacterium]|nr:TonB-dependent receptor [Steroidobacteraceae bacterium]